MARFFRRYLQLEALQGGLAVISAVIALVLANSPWSNAFHALWHVELGLQLGSAGFSQSLLHWVNDGLMVLFFLLVGLEIKRELFMGELSRWRAAAFPMAAAVGGCVTPMLIYLAFTFGTEYTAGWGIPMATDIAFALSILMLLGNRVPNSLKVALAALAIIDDLIAILVIGIFYSHGLNPTMLAAAAAVCALLFTLNRAKVSNLAPYLVLGLLLWGFFLHSGVHATIAGVLLAFAIPSSARVNDEEALILGREAMLHLQHARADQWPAPTKEQRRALRELRETSIKAESPLQRLETFLHPWVAYVVVPLFCLANAGVSFASAGAPWTHPVGLGVMVGLLAGKPLGVLGAGWLAVRFRLAALPSGSDWSQVLGIGMLAGIGFTMSLFISSLAFTETHLIEISKVSILLASVVSAAGGAAFLSWRLNSAAQDLQHVTGADRRNPRHPALELGEAGQGL